MFGKPLIPPRAPDRQPIYVNRDARIQRGETVMVAPLHVPRQKAATASDAGPPDRPRLPTR